jgi:hypothetical protein
MHKLVSARTLTKKARSELARLAGPIHEYLQAYTTLPDMPIVSIPGWAQAGIISVHILGPNTLGRWLLVAEEPSSI